MEIQYEMPAQINANQKIWVASTPACWLYDGLYNINEWYKALNARMYRAVSIIRTDLKSIYYNQV